MNCGVVEFNLVIRMNALLNLSNRSVSDIVQLSTRLPVKPSQFRSFLYFAISQRPWSLPLLRGRLRSCQSHSLLRRWISWKPLEIEAFGSKGPPIENGPWRVEWSRDRWRHATSKGHVVTLTGLEPIISKIAGYVI